MRREPAGESLLRSPNGFGTACAPAVWLRGLGNEFGLPVVVADKVSATSIVRRVLETIRNDYELAGVRQLLGVSVGVALFARGSREAPAVCMQHVDLALLRGQS